MDKTVRRSLLILTALMLAEAVPLAATLASSPPGVASRLWGWHAGTNVAWTAAVLVTIGYVLYGLRSLPLVRARFFELSALKLTAVPFAFLTGAFEELFFRKFLMDLAARHGAGIPNQILLSAAIFGVAHGVWALFGRQWRVGLGATIATGALGALLASIYVLAGRDLAPCVWSHTFINLALEPWLIMAAVAGGRTGWANRQGASHPQA